jgi:hypothetical protein
MDWKNFQCKNAAQMVGAQYLFDTIQMREAKNDSGSKVCPKGLYNLLHQNRCSKCTKPQPLNNMCDNHRIQTLRRFFFSLHKFTLNSKPSTHKHYLGHGQ